MFKLTSHAIQQFLIRNPSDSLIDSIAFLQTELEIAKEPTKDEIKKYNLKRVKNADCLLGNEIIFVIKDYNVITIWRKDTKRIPKAPKKGRI